MSAFSFPRLSLILNQMHNLDYHIIMPGLQFVYKVQLKLLLVYCTCFIKTVLVFTVSAESLPRRSHTFKHTHTTSILQPHAPTPVSCEGLTPKIRQLLGDRVVDLFFNFFEEKSMGECIWPLQC